MDKQRAGGVRLVDCCNFFQTTTADFPLFIPDFTREWSMRERCLTGAFVDKQEKEIVAGLLIVLGCTCHLMVPLCGILPMTAGAVGLSTRPGILKEKNFFFSKLLFRALLRVRGMTLAYFCRSQ